MRPIIAPVCSGGNSAWESRQSSTRHPCPARRVTPGPHLKTQSIYQVLLHISPVQQHSQPLVFSLQTYCGIIHKHAISQLRFIWSLVLIRSKTHSILRQTNISSLPYLYWAKMILRIQQFSIEPMSLYPAILRATRIAQLSLRNWTEKTVWIS